MKVRIAVGNAVHRSSIAVQMPLESGSALAPNQPPTTARLNEAPVDVALRRISLSANPTVQLGAGKVDLGEA